MLLCIEEHGAAATTVLLLCTEDITVYILYCCCVHYYDAIDEKAGRGEVEDSSSADFFPNYEYFNQS